MKKTIAAVITVFLALVFSSTPAHADRKTMEGFLLGTGVTILGTAIIKEMQRDNKPVYQEKKPRRDYRDHCAYRKGYRHGYKDRAHRKHRHYKKHRRGHWEVERIWIEPVYERKWNPGHYNRRGKWVSGRYEKFLVARGYWKEEKTWVRH